MKRPMIAAALVALILSFLLNINSLLAFFLIIPIAIGLVFCLKNKKYINYIAVFTVALIMLLNSVYITTFKINKIGEISSEIPVRVSGQITSADKANNKFVYTLKTDYQNTEAPKNMSISVSSKFAALSRGDSVVLDLYLDPIPSDKSAKYYSREIYAFGTVSRVVEKERNFNLTSLLSDFSERVGTVFYNNLSNESAATIYAITVGDKYFLDSDFEELVKRAGVSHVMVVSGMHMAIICGTFLRVLQHLKFGNRLSSVITAIFVFLFMALCGFSMSVMRAGITYFILLLSLFLTRRTDALNSLAVAVSIIFMLNPFSSGSVGFLLSVFSTVGIIILNKPISNKINSMFRISWKTLCALTEMLSTTLSALIFTFPITVYYFGSVSTVSLISNLLIGQAVTLVLILATLGLPFILINNISYFGSGLYFFCEWITRYINKVISYFGIMPSAYIKVNSLVTIICYLAIILTFVIIKYSDNILKVVKSGACSIRTAVKGKH